LPGREEQWSFVTGYRARLARDARDWPAATALQNALVTWYGGRAAEALAIPSDTLTHGQRIAILNLATALSALGDILWAQDDPGCLPHYREALALVQRVGDRHREAQWAGSLSNAYLSLPGLRDLDQAERWLRHSLGLRGESDRLGRGINLAGLATVARQRFEDARAAGEAEQVLLQHLNDALHGFLEALDLAPADDHESRGIRESEIGIVYSQAGDAGQALRHYQRAIQHHEAGGNIFDAGRTRYNVARLLGNDDRIGEALHYARAALANFKGVGPGAAAKVADAEQFIADLEQHVR